MLREFPVENYISFIKVENQNNFCYNTNIKLVT